MRNFTPFLFFLLLCGCGAESTVAPSLSGDKEEPAAELPPPEPSTVEILQNEPLAVPEISRYNVRCGDMTKCQLECGRINPSGLGHAIYIDREILKIQRQMSAGHRPSGYALAEIAVLESHKQEYNHCTNQLASQVLRDSEALPAEIYADTICSSNERCSQYCSGKFYQMNFNGNAEHLEQCLSDPIDFSLTL